MFNLLRSMAITNLRKNRALYVPFALATVMVTVVLYVTNALAATPEFAHLEGGSAMRSEERRVGKECRYRRAP